MRAIILAAGMGERLQHFTKDKPKGMVEFDGVPLLQWQINILRQCGVDDIAIVRGYKPQCIDFADVRYYDNAAYADTNMVESLLCARKELQGDIVICYGDILYEPDIMRKVQDADCDVGVVADTDFHEYWNARLEHPEEDSESFSVRADGTIETLGEPRPEHGQMDARYVGIIKLTDDGCRALKDVYDAEKQLHGARDEPWLRSKNFRNGYMTDLLQAMICRGVTLTAIPIRRGWLEFDTAEDIERYHAWLQNGMLERFIRL